MELLTGAGHPSKRLKGELGQHYKDTNTGDIWECISSNEHSKIHHQLMGGYIWKKMATGDHIEACNVAANSPSEVVILPETELTLEGNGDAYITVQPSATPTEGGTAVITCNGVKYTSPILRMEPMFLMGNTEAMGVAGGNSDAPFLVAITMETDNGAYGMLRWLDEENWPDNDSVTISIVQTEGAASGGAADSPVVIAKLTNAGGTYSIDKTFDEIASLAKSGKIVYLHNVSGETAMMIPLANYTGTSTPKRLVFSALLGGKMGVVVTYTTDGVAVEMENY